MLHPSHTWATWPTPGLWTTCSALQGWATAADGRQGHTGMFLWGRQGHFVGQAAMQAESPSSYPALNWAGASRPTLCRHTEKPKPGRICDMSALYETDIWQEGKYPPRQKKTCHSEALLCRDVILAICSSAHGCLPVLNWGGSACWTHFLGLAFLALLLSSPIYSV